MPSKILVVSPLLGEDSIMVYQCSDPSPFILNGMQWVNVPGRKETVRAIAGSCPQRRNETVAIASINPLLVNVLNFNAVREVLHEFLVDEKGFNITEIQSRHLCQACVRFNGSHNRDTMVLFVSAYN